MTPPVRPITRAWRFARAHVVAASGGEAVNGRFHGEARDFRTVGATSVLSPLVVAGAGDHPTSGRPANRATGPPRVATPRNLVVNADDWIATLHPFARPGHPAIWMGLHPLGHDLRCYMVEVDSEKNLTVHGPVVGTSAKELGQSWQAFDDEWSGSGWRTAALAP